MAYHSTLQINHDDIDYSVEIYLEDKNEFGLAFFPPYLQVTWHTLYVDELDLNKVDDNFYYKMTGQRLPPEIINYCNKYLKLKAFS